MRTVALLALLLAAAVSSACASSGPRPTASRSSAPNLASLRAPGRVAPAPRHGASRRLSLGRTEAGRAIRAVRAGDPQAIRVLVVGCIHGNEGAGIAVARALERRHAGADLWIVPDLNPDGHVRGTRQNGRGVDLNANWSSQWRGGGRPWDTYYPGPRPFSESETRIARNLILRVRPRLTIWFHQHMNLVWAWGPSSAAGRIYARAARMRFYHHPWLTGTATNWQNHHLPESPAITVELPAGSLSTRQVDRLARAVLTLAARSDPTGPPRSPTPSNQGARDVWPASSRAQRLRSRGPTPTPSPPGAHFRHTGIS